MNQDKSEVRLSALKRANRDGWYLVTPAIAREILAAGKVGPSLFAGFRILANSKVEPSLFASDRTNARARTAREPRLARSGAITGQSTREK